MVTLYCIAELKNPAHVGFGTGKQVKDIRGKPILPSLTLTTQIAAAALRLAKALNRPNPTVKASDGFVMDESKFVRVRGQEFFIGKVYFTVQTEEEHLGIVLGALKWLENAGLGANTSMGFGHCKIKMVKTSSGSPQQVIQKANPKAVDLVGEEEFKQPPGVVRFAQNILNKLKMNWQSWFKVLDPSPFRERVILTGKTEIKNSFAYRGWLREQLIERWGNEHKGMVTTCPPKAKPCRVCRLLGWMGGKSQVTVRLFSQKKKPATVYLIVDNPGEEELEVLKGLGLKEVKRETVEEFVATR